MKHTKEPWQTVSTPQHDNGRRWIVWTEKGPGYGAVAYTTPHGIPWCEEEREQKEADAKRIVSCVNAMAGIPDPAAAIAAAREALERASKLVHLLTIRQVVEAGDPAINAAGLNPYAMNEGADPDATIGAHFISHALAFLTGQQS